MKPNCFVPANYRQDDNAMRTADVLRAIADACQFLTMCYHRGDVLPTCF